MMRSPAPDTALVAAVTLVVLGLWGALDGGYAEVDWYPPAILLLILLLVLGWAARPAPLGRRALVVVGAFGAFTVWSFLSILWAGDHGVALTGANRTLAYFLVLLVAAGRRWRGAEAAALVAVWAFVIVGIGVLELVIAAYGHDPTSAFTYGRLTSPIDYANANAALFALAAWPLTLLAQDRVAPPPLRALALSAAGAGFELALLAQSKGAALGTAGTFLVLLVVLRRRVRFVVPCVAIASVIAFVHGPLLNVYSRLNDRQHPADAIRSGVEAVLVSVAVLAAIGLAGALADRRLVVRFPAQAAVVARVAGLLGLAAMVGSVVAGVIALGHPIGRAERVWHTFKYPERSSAASSHFVSGAGNHRYDFWRVAAKQVAAAPLIGAGVDNFGAEYVRERRSDEQPLYPHSLEARLLGGTGAIGFAIFAVFAVGAISVCVRGARSNAEYGLIGAMALPILLYWLGHGSVDWLWEFPALSGPVLAAVGCAVAADRAGSRRVGRAAVVGSRLLLGVASAAAGLALVPAWLAARDVALGLHVWRSDSESAFSHLSQAARLNPLSDEADVVAGTVAERQRDWRAARIYFGRALKRNDDNWYSQLEDGIAQARGGDRATALIRVRRAAFLDPREPIVTDVLTALERRRPLSIGALDRLMVDRSTVRTAR
jgi:hypothetical protein